MTKFVLILVSVFAFTSSQPPDKVANGKDGSSITPVEKAICPACECSEMRAGRIIGGTKVKHVNQYPWIALLNISGTVCGGSLINSKYVLTAAHCVHDANESKINVYLMEHDLSVQNESKTIRRKVDRIVTHKNFSEYTFNADIALLRLDEKVKQEKSAREPSPICLAQREDNTFVGMNGLIIGWGITNVGGSTSEVLQEVKVPIISNDQCNQIYGQGIMPNKLCALYSKGGKDACQGDSGSPLMVEINSKYQLAGIVSWGTGCGEKKYPGVYTRVSYYAEWIAKNNADACPCPYPRNSGDDSANG